MSNEFYTPMGNAEIVGGVKLKNKELTNQQFFDTIFTKYISFTLPVSEIKTSNHILLKLYSEPIFDGDNVQPYATIDTEVSESDRMKVFGISEKGFFNIPETGFEPSHQGKPVFINLQDYYHRVSFISWTVKKSSDYFYSVFPSMNIDNYGNGKATSGGNEGYGGYFKVSDISISTLDRVMVSEGVVVVNNKRYIIEETTVDMIDYLRGYVVDVGTYSYTDVLNNQFPNFSETTIDPGIIIEGKLDPEYVLDMTNVTYPCVLYLVVSIKDGNFNYYYAINDGKRDDHTTDRAIASISKQDDALVIIQQQFNEIDVKI